MASADRSSSSPQTAQTGPIGFDEALARIERRVALLGQETVSFADAGGRTLVRALRARSDVPRAAVATRDGYAVIAEHTVPGAPLRILGESRAGRGFDGPVGPGEAVRIFTGARLPAGADCVVMQEYADRSGNTVHFAQGYGPDSHVRAPGSDFAEGEVLVPAATRLGSRALVAAGAADVDEVAVARQPRVAILTTGDELAPPGQAYLAPDRIPESIGPGVAALAISEGARVVLRQSEADNLDRLAELAGHALAEADLVVVIGGASVGERDFAKPMFAPHGLDTIFDTVAIKPGKPVWFGSARGGLVLGLPGNPTSAMVTAALFLRPILARLQGASGAHRWRRLPLAAELPATGTRETFVRAFWDEAGLVPLANQDSGVQAGLLRADRLIRCPPHQAAMAASSDVVTLAF